MEFKTTAVDFRGRQELRWFDPRFPARIYPIITKSLPGYVDGLRDDPKGWSRRRAKAMREAVLADAGLASFIGDSKIAYSRTLGCRCGCSGGFRVVGRFGREAYVDLEQTS